MSSLSSSSHAVACICVVGAQNQCLFLRRLVPPRRRDDNATSAPSSDSDAAEQSEKHEDGGKPTDNDDEFADDDLFKLHLLAHSALDVVQERCASTSSSAGTAASSTSNSFLGLLFPTEEHRVYGYVSNTRMKYIVITRSMSATASGDGDARSASAAGVPTMSDAAVRTLCIRLHQLYAEAVSNPFYTVGEELGDAYERKARLAVMETGAAAS